MKMYKGTKSKVLVFVFVFILTFSSVISSAEVEPDNTYMFWGTRVHSAITMVFKAENSTLGNTYRCGRKIGTYPLKPDFVLDKNLATASDIYELKPYSYFSGYNLVSAQTQLTNYVNAYQAVYGRATYRGVSWNPTGRIILVNDMLTGPKSVVLTANYSTPGYEGLVFYQTLNYNPQPDYSYATEEKAIYDQNGKLWTIFAQNQGYVLARSTDNTGTVIIVLAVVIGGVLVAASGGAGTPAAVALVVGGIALSTYQPPVYNPPV